MHYRLGVLGGMGPQATNTFYQFIIDRTDARTDQEHVNALILSDSDMPDRTRAILGSDADRDRVFSRLTADAKLLEDFRGNFLVAFGGEWSVGFLTKHNPGLELSDSLSV